jgi:hypothetical protein
VRRVKRIQALEVFEGCHKECEQRGLSKKTQSHGKIPKGRKPSKESKERKVNYFEVVRAS